MTQPTDHSSCEGACGRRSFLRDSISAAVALMSIAALAPLRELAALEVRANGTVKYPIPAADGVSIDKSNEVIVCRSKGEIYAFALSCPHQNTALRVSGSDGFACPRHKSRYKTDGTFIDGKATRNMDRLQISRDGNDVVVDPAIAFESDTNPVKWGAAVVKV